MNIIVYYLNYLAELYMEHQWLPAVLLLNVYVALSLSLSLKSISKKFTLVVLSALCLVFASIPLEFLLLKKSLTNLFIFISTIILLLHEILLIFYVHINYGDASKKGLEKKYFVIANSIVSQLKVSSILNSALLIYGIWYISSFEENTYLKIFLTVPFGWNIYYSLKIILAQNVMYKSSIDKHKALDIIDKYGGTALPLPSFSLLLNILPFNLISLFYFLQGIQKSKINKGIFDINNRTVSIGINKDVEYQRLIFILIAIILFYFSFSGLGFFISIPIIWCMYIFRRNQKFFSNGMSYCTAITGEQPILRPPYYDSLLNRVLPESVIGSIWNHFKSKRHYEYRIIFHCSDIYYSDEFKKTEYLRWIYNEDDENLSNGALSWEKLNYLTTKHAIIIFNTENNLSNVVCEKDLLSALSSPITIIDLYLSEYCLDSFHKDIQTEDINKFRINRLNLIQHLVDETIFEINTKDINARNFIKKMNKSQEITANKIGVRSAILNSSSFESLRQNINLLENYFNDEDKERLDMLYQNGIFEFNTLFRQLHESPSIPSRFIDLLNISECIIRYVCGFCHAQRATDKLSLQGELFFDSKAISFGSCADFLSRWINTSESSDSILGNRIATFLITPYNDSENVETMIGFIKKLNPNTSTKYSRKPKMLELTRWLVNIRNKTRGHGTPSKVDYDFYACLEKVILFMVSEISKTDIKPCLRTIFDNQEWTINYSLGGLPGIVPVIKNLSDEIHFNPRMNKGFVTNAKSFHQEILDNITDGDENLYLRVAEGDQLEWWCCNDHFKVKTGVVHVLNQRDEKRESWISFSTGKILRPDISEF
jgi:hypothetical protein